MTTVDAASFRRNMRAMLEQTIKCNEPLGVSTKPGTAAAMNARTITK